MKQKQVKVSPKVAKQTKATKKGPLPKKAREVEVSDEEIVEKKVRVVLKKPVNKKATKVKRNVVAKPSEDEHEQEVEKKPVNKKDSKAKKIVVEESSEDEDEEQEVEKKPVNQKASKVKKIVVEEPSEDDDDEEQEAEEQEDDQDVEQEEENDGASEEGDENEKHESDEDEENEMDEEDEDDEAPSEETVEKEEPTIPSKVKNGPIPSTVPSNKIIYITKLPKKCKQIDVVEAFAKYGAIDQIHIITSVGETVASVAYKTEKGAFAAFVDKKNVKVIGSPVWVSMKKEKKIKLDNRDRSVHIKFLKNGTTQEELRNHFESCGEIECVNLVAKPTITFAFVTFKDKSAVPAAIKLHNSVLNGVNIKVVNNEKQTKSRQPYEERFVLMLKNKQNFETIDPAKLEAIFSKCGEIECMDVVCRKNVLAFIRFKTEKGIEKALELNGKTEEEIELDVEVSDPVKRWATIHVSNLPKDCTEEDLTNIFSKAGEISNILLRKGYAIIRFTDCDGYCKSFLYNESFINGQIIFVEPHSIRKKIVLKSKPFQNKGIKRTSQNGWKFASKPKKFKTN